MADERQNVAPSGEIASLGEALRRLRRERGISQETAAAALGQSKQSWQLYETGARQAILRSDLQERIASAIGVTREEWMMEAARLRKVTPPRSTGEVIVLRERGREFEVDVWGHARAGSRGAVAYDAAQPLDRLDLAWMFGPDAAYLRVAGDSMTGYVESGDYVVYNRKVWPKRGEGCVIETDEGEMYVKEFQRQEGPRLFFSQRFPDAELEFDWTAVKGVYRIVFRGG